MDAIADIIIRIASIPVILAGIYSIVVFKRLSSELKIICYFIFLSLAIEIISKIFWFLKVNNLPLIHIYVFIGFILQSWFYAKILKGFINKKIIWTLAISFSVFTIINSVFFQGISNFNTNALTVQSVLILILSISTYLLFLNDIVKNKKDIVLIKSLNWINSGLFIYYSSSLMIFYFGNFLVENYSILSNQYTWAIHALFLLVMYSCFFVGLSINARMAKLSKLFK